MPNRIERPLLHIPFLGLALAACIMFSASAQAGPYLLVEADSGRVIAESDAGTPWYPASVTKLMTTYLAFQAMRAGKVEPLTLLNVSDNAVAQPPSKMGFRAGTQVTLDNALKMLMVRSANDIAVVVAEGIGGSVEAFVQQMNMTAGRLGMSGTHFVNPHGLPAENQVTTARDMAILTLALIREFPEYELYFRIPAIQIGKRIIRNHNRLIDRYVGADGMKTGFICSSGFNMVAAAKRGDKRMIAVVFGAYSATQRAEDAARLLERGFRRDPAAMPDNEFGTLFAMRNVAGVPHDMRDEMCNPKRRRPAAESDIGEDDEEDTPDTSLAEAADKSKQTTSAKKSARLSLLGALMPSMPPIRVFTGLPQEVPEESIASKPAETRATPAKAAKVAAPAKTGKAAVKPGKAGSSAKPKKSSKQPTQATAGSTRSSDTAGAGDAIGAAKAAPKSPAKTAPRVPLPRPQPGK